MADPNTGFAQVVVAFVAPKGTLIGGSSASSLDGGDLCRHDEQPADGWLPVPGPTGGSADVRSVAQQPGATSKAGTRHEAGWGPWGTFGDGAWRCLEDPWAAQVAFGNRSVWK